MITSTKGVSKNKDICFVSMLEVIVEIIAYILYGDVKCNEKCHGGARIGVF